MSITSAFASRAIVYRQCGSFVAFQTNDGALSLRHAEMKIPRPIRIQVPGVRRVVGLGQAVKRVTTSLGIRPCGGCQRRARALDRFVVLAPPRPGK